MRQNFFRAGHAHAQHDMAVGEVLGVLTSKGNQRVFQAKDQVVEATAERLKQLAEFEAELVGFLEPGAS